MPDIQKVTDTIREGKHGFIIEWEVVGFSKKGAKFRAVVATAMRFPTTITTSDIVRVREFGDRDFNVAVFVPTEDFLSAGITDPKSFFEERLPDSVVRIFFEDRLADK